eukprot:7580635-Ditylum_brightwellii.AAC.1
MVYLHMVIYGNFGSENNGQNLVGIEGDAVCSLSVLRGRRPAAGIRDQSWIAIKCKISCVDTNKDPHRFWAEGKVFITTFIRSWQDDSWHPMGTT